MTLTLREAQVTSFKDSNSEVVPAGDAAVRVIGTALVWTLVGESTSDGTGYVARPSRATDLISDDADFFALSSKRSMVLKLLLPWCHKPSWCGGWWRSQFSRIASSPASLD